MPHLWTRRKLLGSLTLALTAPLLYLGSIGPVAYAHVRLGWFPDHALNALYAPLRFLPDTQLIATPMKSYIELWLGPADCGGTGPGG